jgi:capsule polysaccharide modification protein KpsS
MCAYWRAIDVHGTCNIVKCFTVTQPYQIIAHNEAKRNGTTVEVLSSSYAIRPEAITTRSIAVPVAVSMGVNL